MVDGSGVVADDVEFAGGVRAEGGDTGGRAANFPNLLQLPILLRQCPEPARFIVAEDVCPVKRGFRVTPIDVTARDGHAKRMRIGKDRRSVGFLSPAVLIREGLERFPDIPAMVLAAAHDGNLLEAILADIADPKLASERIEAEAPRFAKPDRP